MKPRRFLSQQEELKGLPVPLSEVDDSGQRERFGGLLRLRDDDQRTVFGLILILILGAVIWLMGGETAGQNIHCDKSLPERELHFLVDLNNVQKHEILQLPGIGDTLADRIIEYREHVGPFKKADDLENIQGIGPKKRASVEPYLLFETQSGQKN